MYPFICNRNKFFHTKCTSLLSNQYLGMCKKGISVLWIFFGLWVMTVGVTSSPLTNSLDHLQWKWSKNVRHFSWEPPPQIYTSVDYISVANKHNFLFLLSNTVGIWKMWFWIPTIKCIIRTANQTPLCA